MKIAITGGAGYIGSHLTQAYLDEGHDVLVIDKLIYGQSRPIDPRARFYQIDIRDEQLRTIFQQERPDIVSHHVSQQSTSVTETSLLAEADIHIRGLLNVLNSCVNAAVKKIIFASGGNTLYGHRDRTQLSVTETTPLLPQNAHAISKATGEWYVRYHTQRYGLAHTILRYADVYGLADRGSAACSRHPLHYFITMLARNHPPIIRGTGEAIHDHIYIDDIVQANIAALQRGKNQTVHISSGEGHSFNQLYQLVATSMQQTIRPVYLAGLYTEEDTIILDNTRARHTLGWSPTVSLEEGIRRTIEQSIPQHVVSIQPQPAHVIPLELTTPEPLTLSLLTKA